MRKNSLTLLAIPLLAALLVPGAAVAGFAEAQSFMKAGKFAEAAGELQALIESSGEWPDGHYLLGTCYLRMGKLDPSITEFEKAIELNGERFDYHARLGLAWFSKKDYTRTVEVMNAAEKVATGPKQTAYLSKYRGLSYAYSGNAKAAVANLKNASPRSDSLVASVLGTSCLKVGDYGCAIENLDLAVKADPKDYDLTYYLARAHLISAVKATSESAKKSHYSSAVSAARKALDLKPSSSDAQATLAKSYLGAGSFGEAERLFQDLTRREPKDCTHYLDLITTQREMGKWTAVVDNAGRITSGGGPSCEQKEQAMAWTQAGFAWLKQDDPDRLDAGKRKSYLTQSISASEKAISMGSDGFAKTNRDTARENLKRLEENLAGAAQMQQQEEEICKACLEIFAFQEKTVAFLKETGRPDADADGVADNIDECADTPAWTLVDKKGCPDKSKQVGGSSCNDLLRQRFCQDLHGKK